MKLYIKNMVCPRCIMAVGKVLSELGIVHNGVGLGIVECESLLDGSTLQQLEEKLESLGFSVLHSNKEKLVSQIKALLVMAVEEGKLDKQFKFKEYLIKEVNKDYSLLSKTFSEQEGRSIERYFILLKLEKAKELLTYEEFNLNEIAIQLGYSSAQHLSKQFKQAFGVTPSVYKNKELADRTTIDKL